LFGGDQPKDEVRVEWTWWGTDHQSPVGTFADSRLRALLQSTPKFCTTATSLYWISRTRQIRPAFLQHTSSRSRANSAMQSTSSAYLNHESLEWSVTNIRNGSSPPSRSSSKQRRWYTTDAASTTP
jgi:hypothetical protein